MSETHREHYEENQIEVREVLPHVDLAVGADALEQKAFEDYLTKLYKKEGSKKIEGLEIEKSSEDIELIKFADSAVWKYLNQYGRKKKVEVPMSHMHVLKGGGVEEYSGGFSRGGGHAAMIGAIFIDRTKSDVQFCLTAFHELFHARSYSAIQLSPERKIKTYRSGFSTTSRHHDWVYYHAIEEGIIGYMEERFFREFIENDPRFKEELGDHKKTFLAREEEKRDFLQMVDEIWGNNNGQFKSKQEIIDMFIDAQVNGKLLRVGRAVEKAYGKGLFRMMGEAHGEAREY